MLTTLLVMEVLFVCGNVILSDPYHYLTEHSSVNFCAFYCESRTIIPSLTLCVTGRLALRAISALIARSCEYVILCSKRNFADVIKLKTLKWGDDHELSGRVQYTHVSP